MEWEEGPRFPHPLSKQTTVQEGLSLLIMGGYDGENNVDEMYRIDEDDLSLVLLATRLPFKDRGMAAVLVTEAVARNGHPIIDT